MTTSARNSRGQSRFLDTKAWQGRKGCVDGYRISSQAIIGVRRKS
jgi:hypothetical protein